jgi:hypothetical protein
MGRRGAPRRPRGGSRLARVHPAAEDGHHGNTTTTDHHDRPPTTDKGPTQRVEKEDVKGSSEGRGIERDGNSDRARSGGKTWATDNENRDGEGGRVSPRYGPRRPRVYNQCPPNLTHLGVLLLLLLARRRYGPPDVDTAVRIFCFLFRRFQDLCRRSDRSTNKQGQRGSNLPGRNTTASHPHSSWLPRCRTRHNN